MASSVTARGVSDRPRRPLGQQRWQRVLTWVLLGLSIVGIAGVWIIPTPVLYLYAFDGGATLGLSGNAAGLLLFGAMAHIVLFAATWALSLWFLAKRWVAFYIPLAAGLLATLIYWSVYALIFVVGF